MSINSLAIHCSCGMYERTSEGSEGGKSSEALPPSLPPSSSLLLLLLLSSSHKCRRKVGNFDGEKYAETTRVDAMSDSVELKEDVDRGETDGRGQKWANSEMQPPSRGDMICDNFRFQPPPGTAIARLLNSSNPLSELRPASRFDVQKIPLS